MTDFPDSITFGDGALKRTSGGSWYGTTKWGDTLVVRGENPLFFELICWPDPDKDGVTLGGGFTPMEAVEKAEEFIALVLDTWTKVQ